MKCPICGKEMEKGKLLIYDNRYMDGPVWYPDEEAQKKGFSALRREGDIYIGYPEEYRGLSGENHYEAFYCKQCKKIIAYFDVKEYRN